MKKIIDDAFISMLEARDLQVGTPMSGLFGGNRRSKAYGSSAEFADFREYVPGDDLRRIDWNLYARFEKLYLRLFVDERQLHHKIYIDASSSMDWGEPNKGYTALRLAAALSYLAVQAMDRVSLYVIHKDTCESLCRPFTGRDSFYEAAEKLNHIRFKGDGNLSKAIMSEENPGKNDGLSIIISDFLAENCFKEAVDYLRYRGRDVHLIQVLSRDEITPALSEKLTMLDSEAEIEEDPRNFKTEITRQRIKAYEDAFAWYEKDIKDFCDSRSAGFFSVISDERIEEILFHKATEARLIK